MANLMILLGIGVFVKHQIKRYKALMALATHLDAVYGRKGTLDARG